MDSVFLYIFIYFYNVFILLYKFVYLSYIYIFYIQKGNFGSYAEVNTSFLLFLPHSDHFCRAFQAVQIKRIMMGLLLSGSNQVFRAGQIRFSPSLNRRERQLCFLIWSAIQTSLPTRSPWGTFSWSFLLPPSQPCFCISQLSRDALKSTAPHTHPSVQEEWGTMLVNCFQ